MRRLRGIEGLTQVRLTGSDIVRHRLVQDIVRAYDEEPGKRRSDG
jgi:phosphate starvation-inducible PhoH-like protein